MIESLAEVKNISQIHNLLNSDKALNNLHHSLGLSTNLLYTVQVVNLYQMAKFEVAIIKIMDMRHN